MPKFRRISAAALASLWLVAAMVPPRLAPASPRDIASPSATASLLAEAILNPFYLRIATAVVKNDEPSLGHYAAKMRKFAADKSRPYLWFPATRARVFIDVRLANEDRFVKTFAMLCGAHGSLTNRAKLLPFIEAVFTRLNKVHRTAWVAAAVKAALPLAGPPPGKLYLYLLNMRLAAMKNAATRYRLIHNAIAQAKVWSLKQRSGNGKQIVFSSGLRPLRFVAVNNDAAGLDIPHLQSDATEFLAHYHASGKGSPLVFLISEQAYIRAWLLSPKPADKARIIHAAGWMANWYKKIDANAKKLQPQIAHEWAQWQQLEHSTPPAK